MRVAICSVGTEITDGAVTDTNAAWLARQLDEIGAEVTVLVAVGDDAAAICEAVGWLAARSDAVVVGGGLGPTPDDLTRGALADFAQVPLERRDDLLEEIEARFESFGVAMPPSNVRQADVPEGATAFPPVGTAAGFAVTVPRPDGAACTVYALPGVPWEFRAMAERDVLPGLLGDGAKVTRTVHVTGAGESHVAEMLAPVLARVEGEPGVEVSFLALSGEILVRVRADGATPEEARKRSVPVIEEIVHVLGSLAVGLDDETLEETVARLLRLGGSTVATAESCTAGLVASRLARVGGATDYLRGGLVAYATETKTDVLGVDAAVLDEHGPCSRPTAEAMATRARAVFTADLGVGVVCVAGPASQAGVEVGTTVWALATPDGVRSWSRVLPGDRAAVTERAATAALEALRRHLLDTLR